MEEEIAKSPAAHAVSMLAMAAFLILVAAFPPLASAIADVISWPFRTVDQLFNDVVNWIF